MNKNYSFSGDGFPKMTKKTIYKGGVSTLTNSEQDVLILLTNEFLTTKQIAIRRKCTERRIQKIIQSLKEKGRYSHTVRKNLSTCEHANISSSFNGIRLHGQELHINILYKDDRYKKRLETCNLINIDGNSIRLFRDAIEIYLVKDFYADDVQKATAQSMAYIQRLLTIAENDLKLILVKPRAENIKLVNAHYAEIHNEIAKDLNVKAEKLRIYANDDGKLWFLIDNSFNLHEAEALHPETSKHDMEKVKAQFNDIRNNPNLPLISDVYRLVAELSFHEKEIAAGLNSVVTLLKSQLPEKHEEIVPKERPDYYG